MAVQIRTWIKPASAGGTRFFPTTPIPKPPRPLSSASHLLPPPRLASSAFNLNQQNTVYIRLTRPSKPLFFSTLHDCSQNIPYKGVTGKILQNKELPNAESSLPTTEQILKDRATAARTADWRRGETGFHACQSTSRQVSVRQENALQNTRVTANSQNGTAHWAPYSFLILE